MGTKEKLYLAALVVIIIACLMGCGRKEGNFADVTTQEESSDIGAAQDKSGQKEDEPEGSDTIWEEWEGKAAQIEDDSVIVTKIITEELEDGGQVAMSIVGAEDSSERVRVYFTESTHFEIHEIRNGGVNGESDVTVKATSREEIEMDDTLKFAGYWDGKVFCAENVVIIRVI